MNVGIRVDDIVTVGVRVCKAVFGRVMLVVAVIVTVAVAVGLGRFVVDWVAVRLRLELVL